MTKKEYENQQQKTIKVLENAGIILTEDEKKVVEIADFGLNDLDNIGLQIITYINTNRVCAKELVLFPNQTCPEHKHPDYGDKKGKEETFRCRHGLVYLYVEGMKTENIKAKIPETDITVYNEIILKPGMQYTIMPNTKHWFQAGPDGAIISEFSTESTDHLDVFTDKRIVRETKQED